MLGAATGLMFGLLSGGKVFAASWQDQAVGYVVCGATIGTIIGLCLPQFRRRWVSGIIVALASSAGIRLAAPIWGSELFHDLAPFFGVVYGIIYASLFWRYEARPSEPEVASD